MTSTLDHDVLKLVSDPNVWSKNPLIVFWVLDEIYRGNDTQALRNLRLTCRFLCEYASPLLFRQIRTGLLDLATSEKFTALAKHPYLPNLVKRFWYDPYIIKGPPGEVDHRFNQIHAMSRQSHWSEQQALLARGLDRSAIFEAVPVFQHLSEMVVEYPEYRKRRADDMDIAKSLSQALSGILANSPSKLKHLEIRRLELTDMPTITNKVPLKILKNAEGLPLQSLVDLRLSFYGVDVPKPEDYHPYVQDLQRVYQARCLPLLLSQTPNLTHLTLQLAIREKCFREVEWGSIVFSTLQSIHLDTIDLSEESLLHFLLPSADTLRTIHIASIYLTDGTWSHFYENFDTTFTMIDDLSSVVGRDYADMRTFHTENENDQKSFRRLFRSIDQKRMQSGKRSMLELQELPGLTFFHDFGLMGIWCSHAFVKDTALL